MEHNLLQKEIGHICGELAHLGCERAHTQSWHHMYELELPPGSSHPGRESLEDFHTHIDAMDKAERVGCIVTLQTSIGEISEIAWVRNIGHWSQLHIVSKNIAELMAYLETLRLAKRKFH